MKKLLFGMSLAVVVASPNIVRADNWPSSVIGNWNVIGNQSPGILSISSQAPTGNCRRIVGSIYGNSIEGFYCPFSGRIHFVRKDGNNDTFQVWTGNLSDTGSTLRMGGTFTSVTPAGGPLGEYNFQASQP